MAEKVQPKLPDTDSLSLTAGLTIVTFVGTFIAMTFDVYSDVR